MNNRFQEAVDHSLSSVKLNKLGLKFEEEKSRSGRKHTLSVVFACALLLVTVTGVALTISELIRQNMEPIVEMHIDSAFEHWDFKTKAQLVKNIANWGLTMDGQKLATVQDSSLSEDLREQAADEIIFSVFTKDELEAIQIEQPDVEQQEAYPVPSDYSIFKALWLKESPESDESEIMTAYHAWEEEMIARVNEQYVPVTYASSDEEVRALFILNMSEVLSMSKSECAAAKVDVSQVEGYPLWQVTMTVHGKDLRDSTKMTLGTGSPEGYDAETDTYTYIVLFEDTENGLQRVPDAHSIAEYEYAKLNETIAWPGSDEDVHGYYHRFLVASVAEKAAFSAEYKPVIEAWYAEHLDFSANLEKAYKEGTNLDTLYMITRHTYGIPADGAIQEEEIKVRAADVYVNLFGNASVAELLGEKFEMYVWFDVTDESDPVWKVTVRSSVDANPTGYMNYETRHMVFTPDGTLLRDGGDSRWVAGIETPAADPVSSPLLQEDSVEF